MRGARAYVHAVASAVVLVFLLRSCAVQGFKVPSGSMLPTLQVGDHILSSRLPYGLAAPFSGTWLLRYAAPQAGEIVVLERPGDGEGGGGYFVKRVAAVAGEVLEITGGALIVDGHRRRLAPAGEIARDQRNLSPRRVPPGHVFVLGDNRRQSIDSREWGTVPVTSIKGRVLCIYWSQRKSGGSVRWERLGARVQ